MGLNIYTKPSKGRHHRMSLVYSTNFMLRLAIFFFVLSIKEVTLGVSIIFLCEYETDNLLFHNEQCCGRHIFSVIDY